MGKRLGSTHFHQEESTDTACINLLNPESRHTDHRAATRVAFHLSLISLVRSFSSKG